MNADCVRVMNILYNLGLTESEFEAVEEEVRHTERSGLSIKAVRGEKIVAIDHDNKHNVVINEIYDFHSAKFKPVLKPNTRILLKTLINFDDLPQQVYTLHQIVRCRNQDDKIMGIADNIEELKQRICERFRGARELGAEQFWNEYGGFDMEKRELKKAERRKTIEEELKAVYWLVGANYDFQYGETRTNIAKVIKVFSLPNMRLAFIQRDIEFEKRPMFNYYGKETCEGREIYIQTFKPSDSEYNYVCEGREIFFGSNQIWVCADELLGNISEAEFKLLAKRFGEGVGILTKTAYESMKDALRLEILTERRRDMEDNSKKKLAQSIMKQFKNGKVCRQGFTITPNSITYDGITIKGDKVEEFIIQNQIPTLITLNFQNILITFAEFVIEREKEYTLYNNDHIKVKMEDKRNFSIGNIDIKIEKVKNNFFVNGVKIRSDELHQVIVYAIHFTDREKYLAWLKDVGRESLRLRNALRNGITFKFVIDKTGDNCLVIQEANFTLNLPLKRIEGKTYVAVNGSNYKVRDINALFDLKTNTANYHNNNSLLQRAIKLLFRGTEGLRPSDVAEIISRAKIVYSERIKNSVEFVNNAVRLSEANRISGGWIVKGDSGNEYFVGRNLEVNLMKDGKEHQYLCLLDADDIDRDDEAQVNDAVAKRILALRHDKTTAKDIWEMGDKVDKLWGAIANG